MSGKDLIINEIDRLPEELLPEILDFIKFLEVKEEHTIHSSQVLSERIFEKIWDNAEDAAYDAL
ncbi:MAG: DUF2281 domain-containing protein [Candidatus Acididesulfobacter guangdongensis]|uniref:DUF2281 domain-containing protein n=1 Tax=Acididesulfobacter guangdongensis TaxID=2597225 RepID=A0A519BHD8_ACIG2|nr:MAG: DUF2281 domain-containing protein [Candidatus Acididesulfobacter guangdongensis]